MSPVLQSESLVHNDGRCGANSHTGCLSATWLRSRAKGGIALALFLTGICGGLACLAQDNGGEKAVPASVQFDTSKLPSGESMNKPYGSHLTAILTTINASADQKTKITIIVQNFKPVIAPLRETYKTKNKEYLNKVVTGASAAEIIERQGELCKLHQEICAEYCKMSLDVRKLLSPEQVKLYEGYRAKQGWNKQR